MASSRRSAKNADPAIDTVVGTVVAEFVRALDAAGFAARGTSFCAAAPSASPDALVARPLIVAFSGGLDSTVLLDAAARVLGPGALVAAHVHHGLQPAADAWPGHCESVAAGLGLRFELVRLQGGPARGESVEAWARHERYRGLRALAAKVGAVAVLTAHHADDQVETILMRIARGTGADGLAGIRARTDFDGLPVLRPLLALSRATLEHYARARALAWVEDPSNADRARLRNAFRHGVLPEIDLAAPAFRANLLRLAASLQASQQAVAVLARIDLDAARLPPAAGAEFTRPIAREPDPAPLDATMLDVTMLGATMLDATMLAALPVQRRSAALRLWLVELGLGPPSEARLRELDRQLLLGRGAYGTVCHAGWRFRRYRRELSATPVVSGDDAAVAAQTLRWRGEPARLLSGFGGRLVFEPVLGQDDGDGDGNGGVSTDWLRSQPLTITPGASSAKLRPSAGGHTRTLKNLYQEHGVPAWARPGLPLVWAGGRLLYAAGVGMDRGACWPTQGERVRLRWTREPGDGAAARGATARV